MKVDLPHGSAPAGSVGLTQGGLLVVALSMLLFLLLGTGYAVLGLRDSQEWVRHTDEVRFELVRLQGTLVDAETGQRGYLATGDRLFLQPYNEALVAWPSSFERIRALTVDNPQQDRRLARIHALIEQKLGDLNRGMSARDGGATGAALVPLVAAGKRTMDEIRALVGEMQREELLLDKQRIRDSARHEQILFALLFGAAACLMLVCGTLWAGRNRQQRNDRLRLAELNRALQETARYRLLVESVNDATFILDPKGFVTTWNAAAERIKGYAAADIIGKHFSTFYPAEDVAAGKPPRELVDAARDGVLVDEGWRLRKDGSRFWANVTITAMRSESGEIVGFAKVTRDLTERVRDEERLRHLAAENAALEATAIAERAMLARGEFLAKAGEALGSSLDYRTTLATVAQLAVPQLADWCSVELIEAGATATSQVAVVHTDPGKVQFARELAERYPPDPNARTGAPQVIRSGRSELYTEIPQELLEAGAQDAEHLRLIRQLRLESAMVVPLTGRERILGAISFIYAESARRYTAADLAFAEDFARRAGMAIENAQSHAALGKALEFQERFVAILGHDLRNPLGAIDMSRGLLAQRSEAMNDRVAARILARIGSSSRRMSRMIEQILDLSRSRIGGGLATTCVPTDLGAVLNSVVGELRTIHPSHVIHVHCPPLVGMWDRDRLEQVFSNLVGNALDHGAAESAVTVNCREDAGGVTVEVHNEGPAIPEELRKQLFTPFRRGSRDSRTPKTAGLGLGLFISHELVAAHGGRMDVRSNAADGTTFSVKLPLQAVRPTAALHYDKVSLE